MPVIPRLRIAEEDSVGLETRSRVPSANFEHLQIAVLRLPYLELRRLSARHEPGVAVATPIAGPVLRCDLVIIQARKARWVIWRLRGLAIDAALRERLWREG